MIVTLRPGADPQSVLRTLKGVHNDASNCRGGGGSGVDICNRYVRWVHESVRRLRNFVAADSLDELVLTRFFWAIQAQSATVVDPLISLIMTELDDRVAVLDEACRDLESQISHWRVPGVLVVADSSFYIHHGEKVEELDLRVLLELRDEPVHLLVPIIVADELDRLKESKDRMARWRARHTLSEIDKVLLASGSLRGVLRNEDYQPLKEGGIPRGRVTVEVVLDPPGHSRLPIADDEIVDRALAIETIAGRRIRFITYDTGQATRARAAGLAVVKIPQPPDGDEPDKG